MTSSKRVAGAIIAVIVGVGVGVMIASYSGGSADSRANSVGEEGSASFWRDVDPEAWRDALMLPGSQGSPSVFTDREAPVMIENLDKIEKLLQDPGLPDESRYALGDAVYSLAALEVSKKGEAYEYEELDERGQRILDVAIKGSKIRYEIINQVDPLGGLVVVYYTVGLLSVGDDAALAADRLEERGWTLPEKVIEDAIAEYDGT